MSGLKILWASTSPWTNAGYGVVSRYFVYGLKERGYDVVMYTQQLLGNGIIYNNVPIAPVLSPTPYSAEDIAFWYKRFSRNLLITHWDVWVLHPLMQIIESKLNEISNLKSTIHNLKKAGLDASILEAQLAAKQAEAINWAPYVPIDAPLDEYTTEINVVLQSPATIALIAQSKFGYNEIKKVVGPSKPIYYVPHGVNTSIFKPYEEGEREKLKAAIIGKQNIFIFGFVGANDSDRKDIPGLIKAFSIFLQNNKDAKNAYLLVWSNTKPAAGRSYDLVRLARRYGVADRVFFPNDQPPTVFFDEAFMAKVYNSMDWFATMSSGEGFNLPLLEAMACGVPVIAGDHTAHHELAFDGDYQPRGIPLKAKYVRPTLWTPTHQEYSFIDPYDMADAMAKAYNAEREVYSANAAEFARQYDWKVVIDKYLVPTLEDIEVNVLNIKQ